MVSKDEIINYSMPSHSQQYVFLCPVNATSSSKSLDSLVDFYVVGSDGVADRATY